VSSYSIAWLSRCRPCSRALRWTARKISGSVAHDANDRGVGVVRFPRLVPRDEECARRVGKRTLTNLYNERPTWLKLAHQKLDEAVFAAYGLAPAAADEAILAALLEMNQQRAATTTGGPG
jgi:hypothetical protein